MDSTSLTVQHIKEPRRWIFFSAEISTSPQEKILVSSPFKMYKSINVFKMSSCPHFR